MIAGGFRQSLPTNGGRPARAAADRVDASSGRPEAVSRRCSFVDVPCDACSQPWLPGRDQAARLRTVRSMRRVDPEYPSKPGFLLGVFQVDQHLLRDGAGVLCSEQGEPAAMLEPADDRLVFKPGDNQLAIELGSVLPVFGIGNRSAIGHDRRHRVAIDDNASVVALGREPLTARLREPRAFVVVSRGDLVGGGIRVGQSVIGLVIGGRKAQFRVWREPAVGPVKRDSWSSPLDPAFSRSSSAVLSRAPMVTEEVAPEDPRSDRPCRNFGPSPCRSHPASTEVSSMIFKMTSAGTVTPPS